MAAPPLDAVVDLLRAAVSSGLLTDAASLDEELRARGWQRGDHGGAWSSPARPELGLMTSVTPPSVVLGVTGQDDDVLAATEHLATELEAVIGEPPARESGPDQTSVWWESAHLGISFDVSPSTSALVGSAPGVEPSGVLLIRATRLGSEDDADERDAERARRLAREGSALERWYLAGQGVLPVDVVERLEADDDPAVVTAVRRGARRRERYSPAV